ncbi:translation regulator [Niveomyces insectorum RCEF 264]|uniref:Translation regulator n=1 Tax=Niveomyces insectorum RCEF 264 TaxID=1081102 RepID=A0A167PFV0_9HYPO|nr:translation regulator [Niveomyces insectorum RCEF 264]
MPMLERTAAGLEPCSLQRLLPRAAKPGETTSRALHTTFWQQGAPDVELAQACRGLVASASLRDYYLDMFTPNPATTEPLNASIFLLDFLYPRGALSFMRKLSAGVLDRRGPPASLPSSSTGGGGAASQNLSRPYSSRFSSSAAVGLPSSPSPPHGLDATAMSSAALADRDFGVPPSDRGTSWVQSQKLARSAGSAKAGRRSAAEQEAGLKALDEVLQQTPRADFTDAFDRAWYLYKQLDFGADDAVAWGHKIVLFLVASTRQSEAQRILRIFSAVDPALWHADVVAGAIKAQLTLRHRAEAVSIFKRSKAAEADGTVTVPGFGPLLASAFETRSWHLLAEIWAAFKEKTERTTTTTNELRELARIPNYRDAFFAFSAFLDGSSEPERGMESVDDVRRADQPMRTADEADRDRTVLRDKEFYRPLLGASLHLIEPPELYPFVRRLQSARIYESFIHVAIHAKHTDLAAQAYSEYRQLPGYKPRYQTLETMVREVYYPDNAHGMEDVLKDWYSVRGRLTYWGYQKYLSFYAARGDVTSVYRLWNEFTDIFPGAITDGEDTFAHLLKAHTVRGDRKKVDQVFFDIKDKYGVTPNLICWNIRLHAHASRGRFVEAIRVFEDLCAAVAPDDYSFGTIMALVGSRGDLALVLDLYGLAQKCGVRITEAILAPIVEAYCQNDQHAEAERLCIAATMQRRARPPAAAAAKKTMLYTSLWNTLLLHHGYRHDLVTVNRLLQTMTRLDVAYDDGTYSALLFALAQCRQPRRALELLRAAKTDGLFRPTAHHYTLLMMAYLRSQQPHRALQVNRLMHHLGFQRSTEQIQLVIKAFSRWQEYPPGYNAAGVEDSPADEVANPVGGDAATETKTKGADPAATRRPRANPVDRRELFAKALREFQRSLDAAPTVEDDDTCNSNVGHHREQSGSARTDAAAAAAPPLDRGAARLPLGAVRRFSFVMFLLVQARDFQGVEEVVELYRAVAPADERQAPLPLKLCNALLLADFYEGRFERAKETWRYVLQRTKAYGQPQSLADTRLEAILNQRAAAGTAGATTVSTGEADTNRGGHPSRLSNLDDPTTTDSASLSSSSNTTSRPRIVAGLQYGLVDPLKTMQRLYTAARDPDGLVRLVHEDVLGNGFRLDNKNWNHYVQNLARLGRMDAAFATCEEQLMGRWSGFAVLRARRRRKPGESVPGGGDPVELPLTFGGLLPADEITASNVDDHNDNGSNGNGNSNSNDNDNMQPRSKTADSARLPRTQQILEGAPRYPRPMAYTFMVLTKAYLELERAAPWSSDAERQFLALAQRCPKTVHAVRTMVRMNSRIEGRVFGGGTGIGGAEDGVDNDGNADRLDNNRDVRKGANVASPENVDTVNDHFWAGALST